MFWFACMERMKARMPILYVYAESKSLLKGVLIVVCYAEKSSITHISYFPSVSKHAQYSYATESFVKLSNSQPDLLSSFFLFLYLSLSLFICLSYCCQKEVTIVANIHLPKQNKQIISSSSPWIHFPLLPSPHRPQNPHRFLPHHLHPHRPTRTIPRPLFLRDQGRQQPSMRGF